MIGEIRFYRYKKYAGLLENIVDNLCILIYNNCVKIILNFKILNLLKFQGKLYYKLKNLQSKSQPMINNKYKIIKKLGKGAYGQVFYVKDQNNQDFAIKSITKNIFNGQEYLKDYLQNEIKCMEDMSDSPYAMKYFRREEDQKYEYLICQYCNKGNLLTLQAKQQNKVFKFDHAVEIISQIIKGLQDLHRKGYLHRDLKSQNILINEVDGKLTYKLADFGFAKKQINDPTTILGTEPYMAPEIFEEYAYGVQIDIWAIGVIFYFMLNMSHPFKINSYQTNQLKRKNLILKSRNFSYKKSIDNTLKKIKENCTEDMENFFLKIFQSDPAKRMTFLDIRKHPIFARFFQEITDSTIQVYQSKVKKGMKNEKPKYSPPEIDVPKRQQQLQKQISIIESFCNKFRLPSDLLEQTMHKNYISIIDPALLLSYRYNMNKLKLLCIKNLLQKHLTIENLQRLYPNLRWEEYEKTPHFRDLLDYYGIIMQETKKQIKNLYEICKSQMESIVSINDKFQDNCLPSLQQDSLSGDFKQSYLLTTRIMYKTIRKQYRTNKKSYVLRLIAISTISHLLWQIIYGSDVSLKQGFQRYYEKQKQNSDMGGLIKWLTVAEDEDLNNTVKTLIDTYFKKS